MRYILLSVVILLINHVYGMRVPPTATLMCNVTSMKVSFPKQQLISRLTNAVTTRDFEIKFLGQEGVSGCSMVMSNTTNTNGAMIYIEADYENCGVTIYEDNDKLIYNQTVIVLYGRNPSNSLVFREEHDEYIVKCIKDRGQTESLVNPINVTARETGNAETNDTAEWDITLTRTTDVNYTSIDSSDTVELGDTLFFDLTMTTVRSDIGMYPQECYAVRNSGGSDKYSMISTVGNAIGCPDSQDPTVSVATVSSDKLAFQWQVEAFKYYNSEQIFIKCDVKICKSTSQDSECNRCSSSRKRRESETLNEEVPSVDSVLVNVRSPVFMIVDSKKVTPVTKKDAASSSNTVFSGTSGTIIIVLLAVIVLVVALAVIKKFFFTAPQAQVVSMKSVAGYNNDGMA